MLKILGIRVLFTCILLVIIPCEISTCLASSEQGVNIENSHQVKNINISQEDIDYLNKCQEFSRINMEDSIRGSLSKTYLDHSNKTIEIYTIGTYTEVPKGTDKTFSTTDWGNCGKSATGMVANCDCNYYTSERKAEAASLAAPVISSVWSWADIGKKFKITGNGGQQADIITSGRMKFNYGVIGSASSEITIKSILWDATTGTEKSSKEIFHWSSSALPYYNSKDESFIAKQNIYLEAGHSYIQYLIVKTSASALGTGEGAADALTDRDLADYLQFSGYTRIDSIKIDFK